MRVKEGATGPAEMGKKRNRTKQTDYHNTSDEETVKGMYLYCPFELLLYLYFSEE